MTNSINLYSISDLLEKDFFIPSYQRGYRWTKLQVEDLLNDIYNFANKKKQEKEFYCLQPIVVKEHQWSKENNNKENLINGYEVVDGQQRLTTLKILFIYLIREHLKGASLKDEYGKDIFTINYETRGTTENFLTNICENNTDNIDVNHISLAYKYIREWFQSKPVQRDVREAVLRTLVYNSKDQKSEGIVQVIWYQIADKTNPIDTFIRINMGKIALTSSELIKALFLQERNFGDDNELAKLRQIEIASEWDRIENALQDDDFWWFLNEKENGVPARIEFIFTLMCKVAKTKYPTLTDSIGTDKFSTFRYFYQKFENQNGFDFVKNEWSNVTDYFNRFWEWYDNPVWYHYVGYLIFCGEDIAKIYDLASAQDKTKQDVTDAMIGLIRQRCKNIKWVTADNNDKERFIDLSFTKDKKIIKQILLLFNLEYIVKQCNTKTLIYKFPFKPFKEEKWDVEHIDSFTENALKDKSSQVEWLLNAIIDLPELVNVSLKMRIDSFIASETSNEIFEELRTEVIELVGEDNTNDENLKNNIGNLALLDAGTNRAYGNALFSSKRRTIIEKDKKGTFIPLCTKNVFLKYFDSEGTSRTKWTEQDIKGYRAIIANSLEKFLPKP